MHSSGCGFTPAAILLVRNVAKVRSIVREISEVTPNTDVIPTTIRLDDFTSLAKAAAEIAGQVDKIDVLINNACIMAIPWATNKAGIEKQLAVNHLGHFLLTKLLLPQIRAAGPGARLINLTSGAYGMTPLRFQDWNFSVRSWRSLITSTGFWQ